MEIKWLQFKYEYHARKLVMNNSLIYWKLNELKRILLVISSLYANCRQKLFNRPFLKTN